MITPAERITRWLQGDFGEYMQKVALEPGGRSGRSAVRKLSRTVPVIRRERYA